LAIALIGADRRAFDFADYRLVNLDDFASAAHGAQATIPHSLSDAMGGEPRGFDGHPKRASKLVAAATLLADAEQVGRLEPLVQLEVAGLEHRALPHGELLATLLRVALPQAKPDVALLVLDARQLTGLSDDAAVGADRAIRPENTLQSRKSRSLIVEIRFV